MAAVAFDAKSSSTTTQTGNFSWSHTAGGAIQNGCALVWLGSNAGSCVTDGVAITYNGVAMTMLVKHATINLSLWYVMGVSSGTTTIAVTKTSGTNNYHGLAHTFSNVKQSEVFANGTNYTTAVNTGSAATTLTISSLTVAATSMLASGMYALDSSGFNDLTYNGTRDLRDTYSSTLNLGHGRLAAGSSTSTWTSSPIAGGNNLVLAQIAVVLEEAPPNPPVAFNPPIILDAVARAANW